jgi:hypothetical protein
MSKLLSSSVMRVIKEHKLEPIVTGLNSEHKLWSRKWKRQKKKYKHVEVSQIG